MDDKKSDCYHMVRGLIEFIKASDNITLEEAFDKFLNYCGVNLYLNTEKGVSFKSETLIKLDSVAVLDALREVNADVIGAVYNDLFKRKRIKVSDLKPLYKNVPTGFPSAAFVTYVDTAVAMIGEPKNVLVYTVTNDLTSYRISLINRTLHNLSLFSLFIGNKKAKDINTGINSKNWEFANRWSPVKTNHLE